MILIISLVAAVLTTAGVANGDGSGQSDEQQPTSYYPDEYWVPPPDYEQEGCYNCIPIEIWTAVEKSDTVTLRKWLDSGGDPNATMGGGQGLLHAAAYYNSSIAARFLIDNGANVNRRVVGVESYPPIFVAIYNRRPEIVRLFCERGADLYVTDQGLMYPLQAAADRSFNEIIDILLQRGIPIDTIDPGGFTALGRAWKSEVMESRQGNGIIEIMELRVMMEPPPPWGNWTGHNAFYWLLEHGARLDKVNFSDTTSWRRALQYDVLLPVYLMVLNGRDPAQPFNNGCYPLHLTAQYNSDNVTRFLLDKGANVSTRDSAGRTPLATAAQFNSVEVAKLLLDAGADINAQDTSRAPPLQIAFANGSVEIARLLLTRGADASMVNYKKPELLVRMATKDATDLVEFLVKHGSDLESRVPESSWTPLYEAVVYHNQRMVDALIRLGADLNPVSSYGCTPLIEAVDYMDSAMAKRLADVGANVNYCSGEFGSALSCAAQRGSIDVARMLLDHEADPNVGKPLIVAFTTSADSMVPLLVERGADVNLRGTEGNTPLLMAVQFGSYDLVKYLLEHGAAQSINITDVRQHPLTTAVRKNLPEIVKLLLQYGADPNTVEMDENSSQYEYKSALIYSMEIGNAEIASQLIKSGANVSQYQGQYPLSYSLYLNQFDITKMLVLAGARPQEGELWDGSPLHQAVYQNAPDVVELMLNNGWDVNLGDHFDITPLWWTVQVSEQPDWPITDHSDMARLLIKYGADVNHKRDNGQPLINIAVESRAMWLVKILLDNGADPNITDAARDTPLHCAAKNGDLEMIECLLTRGASKLAVNKGGKTPKETAIANGHPEAAKLLE